MLARDKGMEEKQEALFNLATTWEGRGGPGRSHTGDEQMYPKALSRRQSNGESVWDALVSRSWPGRKSLNVLIHEAGPVPTDIMAPKA